MQTATRILAVLPVVALLLTSCTPTRESGGEGGVDLAEVTAVVDGDTIDVATPDRTERVRIIGIDTPEIGRDGAADECYAQEARSHLNEEIYGRTVELVTDPTQGDVDRYGRLLRHVLIDGRSVAVDALAAGMGREYTYDAPYAGQEAHRDAAVSAEADRIGLWAECD